MMLRRRMIVLRSGHMLGRRKDVRRMSGQTHNLSGLLLATLIEMRKCGVPLPCPCCGGWGFAKLDITFIASDFPPIPPSCASSCSAVDSGDV